MQIYIQRLEIGISQLLKATTTASHSPIKAKCCSEKISVQGKSFQLICQNFIIHFWVATQSVTH